MKTLEFLLLVITVLITGSAFAAQFTTSTGQGYFTWNGQVISDYSFAPNSTLDLVNGITATDTNGTNPPSNQQAFNSYICTKNNDC